MTSSEAPGGSLRILMIAGPGAGKGTQAKRIASHFRIPHIATGDLLRDHVKRETDIGKEVKSHLDKGELVPDDVVLEMVSTAVREARESGGGGYVLDGMPRTMEQARALYKLATELDMTADAALHLVADEQELTRRLLARAEVEGRSDDNEDVIRRRIAAYNKVTHPIVEWYAERGILISVDAMRAPDDVGREIITALEVLQSVVAHIPEALRTPVDLSGLSAAFGAEDAAGAKADGAKADGAKADGAKDSSGAGSDAG